MNALLSIHSILNCAYDTLIVRHNYTQYRLQSVWNGRKDTNTINNAEIWNMNWNCRRIMNQRWKARTTAFTDTKHIKKRMFCSFECRYKLYANEPMSGPIPFVFEWSIISKKCLIMISQPYKILNTMNTCYSLPVYSLLIIVSLWDSHQ